MNTDHFLAPPVVGIDRVAHRRSEPGLLGTLQAQPSTRVVAVHRGRVATEGERIRLLAPQIAAALPGAQSEEATWLLLGQDASGAYLGLVLADAVDLDADFGYDLAPGATPPGQWMGLRAVLEGPDVAIADLAVAAVALAAWHAGHRFCPRCGAPTRVDASGWVRRCSVQGTELYPRTDPAVIMAITDPEDRLLLGHVNRWPEGRFSTLAGFVEPGETAESAVRREVAEEVGVDVGEVRYRGSQPWPFPGSLMLAYRGQAQTTDLRPDGQEITDARWFTRSALAADVAAGRILMPSRASIARLLIEDWFGDRLPD